MAGERIISTGGGWQSGFEGLAKAFPNPADEARLALSASTAAKNMEDINKARALQETTANLKRYIDAGGSDPKELAGIMSGSPEYLSRLNDLYRYQIYTNPGSTTGQKNDAYQLGGGAFSGTETGFREGERNQTQRTLGAASIQAAPGHARVAEDRRQFNEKTHFLTDPNTGLPMAPVRQRDIYNVGPVQPYSADFSTNMRKPVEYGTPGGPNMQRSLADYSSAFQGQPVMAPTPPSVQVQREEPMFVSPAPGEPGRATTKGAVAGAAPPLQQGQPVYQPPPQAQPVAPPPLTKIDDNALIGIEQTMQAALARSAGLPDSTYMGANSVAMPSEVLNRQEAILQRAAELYSASGNMAEAVRVAMDENLGVGWKHDPRSPWQFGIGSRPFTLGTPGYTGPQVQRDPSGTRVVPPTPPRVQTNARPTTPAAKPPATPTPAQAQPIARAPAGTADGTRMQTPDGRPGVVRGGLLYAE